MFKKMLAKRQGGAGATSSSQGMESLPSTQSTQSTQVSIPVEISTQTSVSSQDNHLMASVALSTASQTSLRPPAPKKVRVEPATRLLGDGDDAHAEISQTWGFRTTDEPTKVHKDAVKMWNARQAGLGDALDEFVRIETFAMGLLVYNCVMCRQMQSKKPRSKETVSAIARHVITECPNRARAISADPSLVASLLNLKRMVTEITKKQRASLKKSREKKQSIASSLSEGNTVQCLIEQRDAAVASSLARFVVESDLRARTADWMPHLKSFIKDVLQCAEEKGLCAEDLSSLNAKRLNDALKAVKNRVINKGESEMDET